MFLIILFITTFIALIVFGFFVYYGIFQKVVIKDIEMEEQNMIFQQYKGKKDGLV